MSLALPSTIVCALQQREKMAFSTFLGILITLLMVTSFAPAQHEGRSCTLPNGGKGRCIGVDRCAPLKTQLLINKFTLETCGEDGNFTICCPLLENIVTPYSKCEQKCLLYNSKKQQSTWGVFHNMQRFPTFTGFIVGGVQATAKEFPHMAALGFGNENEIQWKCGGSLISEQFILTAAHCVSSTEIGELKRVRLGDLNLWNTIDDQYLQEFSVAQIFRHPKYVPPALYNDIALVQLDHAVQITDYVRPACLPANAYIPNSNLIATGWGRVQFVGPTSEQLMKVALDYFSNALCTQAYSSVPSRQLPNGIMDETQICAGDIDEQMDTCQGDSGGPLQITDPVNPSRYNIIGVTSFGKGCGTSTNPGVYTRVFYYVPWIEQIVWSN